MRFVVSALSLVYPLLIFFGLARFAPRSVALVLGGLIGLRWLIARRGRVRRPSAAIVAAAACGGALILLCALFDDERFLLALPVLINVALLSIAVTSLIGGGSIIESLARMQVDDLSTEEVRYCRAVTRVWCAFFICNGVTISGFALAGSRALWTLYTGCISYLLIGVLFAVEFVYRHYRFRRYIGAPTDRWLKRIFPPRTVG